MTLKIKNQYVDGDMEVIEYENGYVLKVVKGEEFPPGETLPVPPTLEQRLKALEEATNVLLGLE